MRESDIVQKESMFTSNYLVGNSCCLYSLVYSYISSIPRSSSRRQDNTSNIN